MRYSFAYIVQRLHLLAVNALEKLIGAVNVKSLASQCSFTAHLATTILFM